MGDIADSHFDMIGTECEWCGGISPNCEKDCESLTDTPNMRETDAEFEKLLNRVHPSLTPIDTDIRNAARWGCKIGREYAAKEVEAEKEHWKGYEREYRHQANLRSEIEKERDSLKRENETLTQFKDRIKNTCTADHWSASYEFKLVCKNIQTMVRFTEQDLSAVLKEPKDGG